MTAPTSKRINADVRFIFSPLFIALADQSEIRQTILAVNTSLYFFLLLNENILVQRANLTRSQMK